MDLKIVSYNNCNSIRKNSEIVQNLMSSHDIILLQEIFLVEDDINFLGNLNILFEFAAVPSSVNLNSGFRGRPKGGLAILWRRFLNQYVRPIIFSNRIMGIELSIEDKNILIINVYFPCDYRDLHSLILYRTVLAEMANIFDSSNADTIVIAGDMNCDPFKGRFFAELCEFVNHYNCMVADLCLPVNSFTYLSAGNSTVTRSVGPCCHFKSFTYF